MVNFRIFARRTTQSGPPQDLQFGEIAYSDTDQRLHIGRATHGQTTSFIPADQISAPAWADVSGKPSTFPPTLPIPWEDVSSKPSTFPPTLPIPWNDVSGKPATFPPTLPIPWNDVSGKPATFPPTLPIPWNDVSGKPATFPPTLPISVGDVTGAAPLASPAFTGNPTAPTQSTSNNSTRLATTAFVKSSFTADFDTRVGRQLIGSVTANGSQNALTVNATGKFANIRRWSLDWEQTAAFTTNNRQLIFLQINGINTNNQYQSFGLYIQDSDPPGTPTSFNWSASFGKTLIVLNYAEASGQNLAAHSGRFIANGNYWYCSCIRHITNVRLCDYITQQGWLPSPTLASVNVAAYSTDASAFVNFPNGFKINVWAEDVV